MNEIDITVRNRFRETTMPADFGPSHHEPVTPREREVWALVALGRSTKEIASELQITFKTAACHRSRIMAKLSCHNTADLTRNAIRYGVIDVFSQQDAVVRQI
jgi:DNA-binding NarL/FixJ family response regulator